MRYEVTKTLHVQGRVYAPGEAFDPASHDLPQHEIDWLLRQEAIEVVSSRADPAPAVKAAPSVRRSA